jgi:hypothetical protein
LKTLTTGKLAFFATLACSAVALPQSVTARAELSIPDFSGFWVHGVEQIVFDLTADGGPGPVIDILNKDCSPNCPPRPSGQPFIGDPSNPNLKPDAVEAVDAMGERWRGGEIVNVATELCGPSGVPHVVTLFGLVQFLQSPDQVTILYERDHQVRRIYLNQEHSENFEADWYGESIGHYEGNSLVVDTIGLGGHSLIDRFGVPQTSSTHVVERYRVSGDGNALVAHITVSDPKMFHKPWSGMITYSLRRNANSLAETRCAENNKDAATGEDYPIPIATAVDF